MRISQGSNYKRTVINSTPFPKSTREAVMCECIHTETSMKHHRQHSFITRLRSMRVSISCPVASECKAKDVYRMTPSHWTSIVQKRGEHAYATLVPVMDKECTSWMRDVYCRLMIRCLRQRRAGVEYRSPLRPHEVFNAKAGDAS